MQLDHIIQQGVWTGSHEQLQALNQAIRDANFEGFTSAEQYLETIEEAHNEDSIESGRGPIDDNAKIHLSFMIVHMWDKLKIQVTDEKQ